MDMPRTIVTKLIEAEAEKLVDQIAPRLINKFLPIIEQRITEAVTAALAAAFHPLPEKEFGKHH